MGGGGSVDDEVELGRLGGADGGGTSRTSGLGGGRTS